MFNQHYAALRAAQTVKDDDGKSFDDHVFACVVSAALTDQAATGLALTDGLGLTRAETAALFQARFPLGAAPLCLERAGDPTREMEENLLRDMLASYGAGRGAESGWLAAIVARRAMGDDHLWQDMGLSNRGEVSRLLARHFPALHAANVNAHAVEEILLPPPLRARRLQPLRRPPLLGLRRFRLVLRRRGRPEPPCDGGTRSPGAGVNGRADQPPGSPGMSTPNVCSSRITLSARITTLPANAATLVSKVLAKAPMMSLRRVNMTGAITGPGRAKLKTTWLSTTALVELTPAKPRRRRELSSPGDARRRGCESRRSPA